MCIWEKLSQVGNKNGPSLHWFAFWEKNGQGRICENMDQGYILEELFPDGILEETAKGYTDKIRTENI